MRNDFRGRGVYAGGLKEKGEDCGPALWLYASADHSSGVSGFALLSLCSDSRLIAAVTNCPVLSPGSFVASIALITSCGTRAAIVCDLAFTALVAITAYSSVDGQQHMAKNKSVQHLTCSTPLHKLVFNTLCFLSTNITKPGSVGALTGPLTTNVMETNAMATPKCTQTHHEFTWRFLAVPENMPDVKPIVLYTIATCEGEARQNCPGWRLFFAARLPFYEFCILEVKHA